MKLFKTCSAALALAVFVGGIAGADDATALARLKEKVPEPRVGKNRQGEIVQISVNAPNLTNEELALFNQFQHLQKLTISHAGYKKGGKTGVDFSGVAALKDHPSLKYFSAGGAIGKEYLKALSQLSNIDELYIQTTNSMDEDWAPIGEMTHLTYLGVRVRNDRMSKLSEGFFPHLMPLDNLERFLLSEMTFKDPQPFVDFVISRPNLKQLTLRKSKLPEASLAEIRKAKPDLEIVEKN
ncbi:hypothetical protein [Stratiformator vulcanicus]|uniref:Leucine Rich repeats (2 copies) n=1 Tax=Stratiformator vulcanicus TaxID=2527980 RepID=A0A517R185_9PLAN|nr:hypothetical protein [Stratiformator vulcanicus]QDT37613.1 hypothetical protein Pan189_19930 [Stratiformator vulcanicus]